MNLLAGFAGQKNELQRIQPGNTKGGSIAVPLTSCLTGLDKSILQIKTKIVSCHAADSKLVKQEVNGKVILPPLVFPDSTNTQFGRVQQTQFNPMF